MKQSKTLIYPGIGYDTELVMMLRNDDFQYDHIIAYDTLPGQHHYRPGQPGWKHTKTRKKFFSKLAVEYGKYNRVSDKEIHFNHPDGWEMTYFHDTNAELIKIPHGDILFRGYMPSGKRWIRAMKEKERTVHVSCDTHHMWSQDHDIDYCVVHFCNGGYCFVDDGSLTYSDEESSTWESEEEC